MVFTNTHPVRVHPAGGIDPLLGTNPLAFAFPAADGAPIVMDLATSTSAIGHVRIASYSDAPIPAGIAIDRAGKPTTDAQASARWRVYPARRSQGICARPGGRVAVWADHRRRALASELQRALAAGEGERRRGHLFVALDPGAFGDRRCERGTHFALCSRAQERRARLPGCPESVMPGERGREKSALPKYGIPLDAAIWQNTLRIAAELGVAAPQL